MSFEHLAPDQVITATPRALVAEWAKMAKVSERVSPGAITRSMLSDEVLADLNKTAHGTGTDSVSAPPSSSITRDMLSADLRADLNRTVSKQMLGQDVLSDLLKLSPVTCYPLMSGRTSTAPSPLPTWPQTPSPPPS